jgi:ETC complex I subunit conserved region
MAQARILRPAKSAMSSGKAATRRWVLEFEPASKRTPEPLMGWVSANDTLNQVRLKFPSLEAAEAYAIRQGLSYTVEQPHDTTIAPKSYADNFRFDRIR